MGELTTFGTKNSLTLPSLSNKYFNSLRDENDELISICTDPFFRNFFRQNIKGGRCNVFFHQHYKFIISDNVFNSITKELDINANICEILDKYFEFLNNYEKLYEGEVD